jgi:hypothetical protein
MRTTVILTALVALSVLPRMDAEAGWRDRIRNRGDAAAKEAGTNAPQTSTSVDHNGVGQGATRTRSGNKGTATTAAGNAERTGSGATWQSQTKGETKAGKAWTTDAGNEVSKNDDGSITVTKDGTTTLEGGHEIDSSRETTVTKTEDGHEWNSEAELTGERGTATVSGMGASTRTEDGTEWKAGRAVTGADGREAAAVTEGQGVKDENGVSWSSDTTGVKGRTQTRSGSRAAGE